MRSITRREALELLIAGAMAAFSAGYAELGFAAEDSNFKSIYLDPRYRRQFLLFLKNVFNLYPEGDYDRLIYEKTIRYGTDREIYQAILAEIPGIKPALREVRYALPALKKQKEEMCRQTLILLDGRKKIDGYVEIGSPGRYLSRLKKDVDIKGRPIIIDAVEPRYRPNDVVERGQVRKIGAFVPLGSYEPIASEVIPDESVDLVTVYIGFHHAPGDKRDEFIRSCMRTLRKNGMLIVRDHDVASSDMVHFVALAHDVFNCGLELPWEANEAEVRHFASLAELEATITGLGMKADERRLLQPGDPTRNTLMKFVRS